MALFRPDGAPVDAALLARMTDRLAHRGPDGRGLYTGPGIGLGHRRLAIIDVAGGQQPLRGRDPERVVVFNGEVYNYREARRDLPGPWRTVSDTEVFLRAYETHGLSGLETLVGMWGAAIWDGPRRELIVIRDRLGVKPVYHAPLAGGAHAFASELRALLEIEEVSRRIDADALDALLTYRYVPAPRTLLEGVQKVLPGRAIRLGDRGLTEARYWQPVPQPDPIPDEEAEEAFIEIFDRAVDAHLVSDVPIGVFLSGGVDSAALLQSMGPGVHCFTVGFEGDARNDEIPLAAETCRVLGGHHHAVTIGPREYEETFDAYVRQLEEPVLNDSALATYYLSRAARNEVKVVLSGQGADEPLAGYDRFKGEALAPWVQAVPGGPRTFRWFERAPVPEKLRRATRALGEPDPLARALRIYAVMQEEDKARLLRPERRGSAEVGAPLRRLHEEAAHLSPLGRMLYADTRLWLPDDLLLVADKLSMAHGLELRVPYLDHRLVEQLERMPDAQKLRWGWRGFVTKAVHRRVMGRRLPAEILARKKLGFDNPMDAWLRGPLRPMVEARLLAAGSPLHEWMKPAGLRDLLDRHVSGALDHRRALFLLLTLDAWMRLLQRGAL